MSEFEDRENAFEKKFVHDEEVSFKAHARRNKLLGQWAAGLMGYVAAQAETYTKEVVVEDFKEAGDDDVVQKLLADFAKAGIAMTEQEVRVKMVAFYKEALKQVTAN